MLAFLLLAICFSCSVTNNYNPVANKGYLDLSGWDFERDGIISLNGTWEFYWNNLYAPEDFSNDTLNQKLSYLKVPGVWNSLVENTENLPGVGFGTYHLVIKLNRKYLDLGIKILDFSSSFLI